MTSVGERIYDLRNRNNMSQGNLADKLDISRQTVSKWENNMCMPETEKLIQLSEIFGVSTDYILKGRTIVEPEPVYIYIKDPESENTSKHHERIVRKYIGIVLAILGGLLTFIFLFSNAAVLVFITVPITIFGILMVYNIKHSILIVSWITYIALMCWLPFGTAFNPLLVFIPIFYGGGIDIIAWICSLATWIGLAILILCTIKAKRGYIFKPKDKTE